MITNNYGTEWLDYLRQKGKSDSTVGNYGRSLAHFICWSERSYGQAFDPALIIERDVADWKAYQQTVEAAKPNTVNVRLVALSRFFKWAVAQGYARSDPTLEVDSVRAESRRPKSLDKKYVRRLRRQVQAEGNARDEAIVELLLGTGLRVGELLALKVEDLTLNDRSGEVRVRYGKGGVYRTVPLTANVRKALRAYLDTEPELQPDDLVWVGERGPLKDRGGIFLMLKKYAFRAGLDENEISPHVLRHTFTTRYLEANPDDLRGLAAILGHSSLNTVMIYTEPTTEALAGRMERAEKGQKQSSPIGLLS